MLDLSLLSAISDPVTTVILGAITYVSGIILVKIFVKPYRELNQIRGEIARDIMFYNEYLANDTGDEETRNEIKTTFRRHASDLNGMLERYSYLGKLSHLPGTPTFQNLEESVSSLIGLSNIAKLKDNEKFRTYDNVKEVEKKLGLNQDEDNNNIYAYIITTLLGMIIITCSLLIFNSLNSI